MSLAMNNMRSGAEPASNRIRKISVARSTSPAKDISDAPPQSRQSLSAIAYDALRSRLRTACNAISSLRTVFCAVIRSVWACCQSLSEPPCAK